MAYVDILIVSLFAVWGALSLIRSGLKELGAHSIGNPAWLRTFDAYDKLRLLPNWCFFADPRGWSDFYIYVRGLHNDCTFTEWRDISPKGKDGEIRLFVPTRRICGAIRKAAIPLIYTAARAAESDKSEQVIALKEYQFLLNYIRSQIHDASVERVQFLIASSRETKIKAPDSPRDFTIPDRHVQFVSPFHIVRPHEEVEYSLNTYLEESDTQVRGSGSSSLVHERRMAVC